MLPKVPSLGQNQCYLAEKIWSPKNSPSSPANQPFLRWEHGGAKPELNMDELHYVLGHFGRLLGQSYCTFSIDASGSLHFEKGSMRNYFQGWFFEARSYC